MKALSLFSSAGIGELGLKAAGVEIIVANELEKDRASVYQANFPETLMISGPISENFDVIRDSVRESLGNEQLDLVYATPPCQGMSSNGAGKLRAEILKGNRPILDERNMLIIPALELINDLNPKWVIFENVPGMRNTVVPYKGEIYSIPALILKVLGDAYRGQPQVIKCSDFGVPQLRTRLISVYSRSEKGRAFFCRTKEGLLTTADKKLAKTVRELFTGIPPLDSLEGQNSRTDFHPLHYVSVMRPEKYEWVRHTRPGDTAFNNQCISKECGYQLNPGHQEKVDADGAVRPTNDLVLDCVRCGAPLPRPKIFDEVKGVHRPIKGFHSAYRRMDPDKPARAITINFPFEASDNKIHPFENRTLSPYEAALVQTVTDYNFQWINCVGNAISRSLIAQILGEAVPPRLIETIALKIRKIEEGQECSEPLSQQIELLTGNSDLPELV